MADILDNLVFSEEDVVTFEKGLPGFEDCKKFVLAMVPTYEPFQWLVSTEKERLRFAVINPLLFQPDYDPKIDKSIIEGLGLEKPEDVLIYTIVTLSSDPKQTTANLMGPILINKKKRVGKQIILDDAKYSVKERIIK